MNSGVLQFVKILSEFHSREPIVEYGSKQVPWQQGQTSDLRPYFKDLKYVGCDLQNGPGVDKVDDLTQSSFADLEVGTLLVCETLEHCVAPWLAVLEMFRILYPSGLLVVTTPFFHPIHHMPDLWRWTPQGLRALLEGAGFYAHVYFQGDLAVPRVVYALAAKDKQYSGRAAEHFEKNIGRMPGKFVGERIYKWLDQREYARLRQSDPKREKELNEQFTF